MNILFISHGIYEYDGRMRELIKSSKQLGNTIYITRANSLNNKQEKSHKVFLKRGILSYPLFILKSVLQATKMKDIDLLFIDNRPAVIPALIIKFIKKPKVIVQDVRELYLKNEVNHFSGKVGCFFEETLIRRADILISANKYRSEFMYKYYSLRKKPIVYENIRTLEYGENISKKELQEKFKDYLKKDTFKIISTSGCVVKRTNDKLVSIMKRLGIKFELFLVGSSSKEDITHIKKIISQNEITNVTIVGNLDENELKFFIRNCNLGIVNYGKSDTNNKLCASGKIYEFLYEGIPVVTTENLPLVEMVDNYKIGASDDGYYDGIIEVYRNYSKFKENVKKYTNTIDPNFNNQELVHSLKQLI